ncbi:hypothetical protein B0T26DRAFT_740022 [Lasiosphaeria miniovina]|uniref:Glycosyltransferase family 28 N-terminal domain-containing protein n=1 Tax=Lasiosphaeria miniovina TaxID=1954250 RepID=A0AA40AVV7_9PEZI|nr:uncharacterized protein B0T26DRAFT_740022 [Lasiosphaeria miniovina]KAK0722952.1 hypothetical protein B0T26DRAFT_740022 [Lasiosphaeria miniovina]
MGDDGVVQFQSTVYHGQPVTVVRDEKGHTVYPTYVPPATESPTTPTSPTPPRALQDEDIAPDSGLLQPNPGLSARPSASVSRQWATELPLRRDRSNSSVSIVLPPIRRAGTHKPRHYSDAGLLRDIDPSSSESSSDDETVGSEAAKSTTKKRSRKHRFDKDHFRRFQVGNEHYHTKGKVSKHDGRLNISVKDTSNTGYLAKALGTAVKRVVPLKNGVDGANGSRPYAVARLSSASTAAGPETFSGPKLNIVIMVIGSRGDAQPFLKIGKVLKEQYGHRVRIATHPAFREFVEKDSGLEFFSVGGDPSELMAFMVKNPGMIPTLETVKAGDIGKRRAAMAEMFAGFWRACINATDDEHDTHNIKMMGSKDPFVADAIIANPPSFAHIHCAEALGIPLHLMFTFPYTPTQAFPHPLASIKRSNVDPGYANFISYPLVEMMVWQGLGDLINDFRVNTLALDPLSTLWAPGATYRMHVPYTYLWSPGLVPKPADWGDEIDISGFVFLDLASAFHPPDPLTKFLEAGEAPIYIGFGSIIVDDADRFTHMIFEAVKMAGVRALVSKGWGGLGGDSLNVPDNIFLLDNTPHDWLFPKMRACVIHGGAGTTAIALKCGKPTMIVPFFGDQNFWGSMVGTAKAGPEPVPYKSLTAENLAKGIKYCLTDEAAEAARELAKGIELEGDGAENACKSFHKHMAMSGTNSVRCSILPNRVAVWLLKNTSLRLSTMAADFLVQRGYISWKRLRLLRHNEWNDFEGPGEPVTGVAGSLMGTVGNIFGGIGGVPYRVHRSATERRERNEKRRKRKQKKEESAAAAAAARDHKAKGKGSKGARSPETQVVDHAVKTDADAGAGKTATSNNGEEDNGEDEDEEGLRQTHTKASNAMGRYDTQATTASTTYTEDNPAEEFAAEVGKGAFKSAAALVRAPMDLSLALAQGFHNAPRLYGDDTVRRPTRVTGIKSGLRAAKHEFFYGIYDGWTGVVRLPYRGARDGGARGFAKGVGMGVTGFVLKDIAAIIGPVGYTLKGIVKQAQRSRQPAKLIRRARIVQGQRETHELDGGPAGDRRAMENEVVRGWETMRALWEALEAADKKASKLRGPPGVKARMRSARAGHLTRRGQGAAFESVETAKRALAALKRGEDVDTVIGRGNTGRNAVVGGKSSPASAAAAETDRRRRSSGRKKKRRIKKRRRRQRSRRPRRRLQPCPPQAQEVRVMMMMDR